MRELLAQLGIASALTLIAASYVGYCTARAALRPVERYRSGAATLADGAQNTRLDVPADRRDETTRLGHTLNHMLDRLEAAAERERRFIADASHELRTPLTLMRAELDVALHRPRSAGELTETLRSVDTEVLFGDRGADRLPGDFCLHTHRPSVRRAGLGPDGPGPVGRSAPTW